MSAGKQIYANLLKSKILVKNILQWVSCLMPNEKSECKGPADDKPAYAIVHGYQQMLSFSSRSGKAKA